MSIRKQKGEPFFFYYNLMILILVVAAFGTNAMINFEDLPPMIPLVIVHGIFMFGWYGLVVVQAGLIKKSNQHIHSILGKSSMALAGAIVISGILMTLDSYTRSGRVDIVTVNLFMTINFIVLYSLAIYKRRHAIEHKRLILFSGIAMMLPALGRITQAANINDFISIPMWLILLLIPLFYDLKKSKKIQKSSVLGISLIIIGIVLTLSLMEYSGWVKFLESTIGQG